MKKFVSKSVDSIRDGDRIWLHGRFMTVTKIKRAREHPVLLYRLWIEGVTSQLCVPAGWQVKVEKSHENPEPFD